MRSPISSRSISGRAPRTRAARAALTTAVVALGGLTFAACGGGGHEATTVAAAVPPSGPTIAVVDTMLPDVLDAPGRAEPVRQATLATKLMGSVTAVLVQEGDVVRAGQVLLRLDAADVQARGAQAQAAVTAAEAMLADAERQVTRMRALYADSAAPRAQWEAAEAGYERAKAGVAQAKAAAAEASAMLGYGAIEAPFDGVVTQRLVDPGAFAAPGVPLLTVQDDRRLRVRVQVPPTAVRELKAGARVGVTVEGIEASGIVEGVVNAPTGGLRTVNVLVDNADRAFPAGGAATVAVPGATRRALLVPAAAIVREGDLTGVEFVENGAMTRRWVRTGRTVGGYVEVLSGLSAGDQVVASVGTDGRA